MGSICSFYDLCSPWNDHRDQVRDVYGQPRFVELQLQEPGMAWESSKEWGWRGVECGNSSGHIWTFRQEVSNKRGLWERTQLTMWSIIFIYIYIHCFLHVRIGYIAIIRVLCSPFLVQHRRIPHSERCLSFSLSCHARPRPPELQKSSKKWRVTLVSRDDILGRLRLPY